MSKVTFVSASKEVTELNLEPGETVMSVAVNNMLEGIVAECGGALGCATCHCYVDDAWQDKFAAPSEDENALLDAVPDRKPGSRLACQLSLNTDMDGLQIHLPESQY